MPHDSPDHESIKAAVALAVRAPSIHNSQPWRWVTGDSSLHLFADPGRHLPETDPDGRDLVVSCGAALHHLRVGFAALGWATTVQRLPNPAEPDHLAAVTFSGRAATAEDIALAAAITNRRTDRRRFTSWPVPAAVVDVLVERAAQQGVVAVSASNPHVRFRLTSAISEASLRQGSDHDYESELTAWAGHGSVAVEGVPAANAPSTAVRHGDTAMRTFPGGTLGVSEPGSEEDAGELMVLATATDDRCSQLRAGEALSAVLLAATGFRLATCPLSQPVEIPEVRELLHDQVLDGAAFPQLVLRIGWAPVGGEPLPTAPRRAATDLLGVHSSTGNVG